MESSTQEINLNCEINGIEKGSLKNLLIVKLSCDNININFDIVENINIFNEKDKVRVIISRTKPSYTNKDFCGHGYIVTELKDTTPDGKYNLIISLFGLLVKISNKESLLKTFGLNVMDHVYFCVKKISS
ncbi:hypothetical protein SACC_01900 [Saccharolobus caldissimus]|uniref:DNA-directed RNA polymerase subunit Rpo8 n=2 Tax=Saccharolobus caldissimus TaxID=1702097 RepID=A0AAQ4CMZ2_9CREN|nr:hypothetical protein SACC_01900 [Saccharolobus caldissimus]